MDYAPVISISTLILFIIYTEDMYVSHSVRPHYVHALAAPVDHVTNFITFYSIPSCEFC